MHAKFKFAALAILEPCVCLCMFLLDAAVVRRRLHGDVSGVVMVTDVLIALHHVLILSSLKLL